MRERDVSLGRELVPAIEGSGGGAGAEGVDEEELPGNMPIWADAFFTAFEDMPTIRYACEQVGLNRVSFYNWKKKSPRFAKRFDMARESAIEKLEESAFKRATGEQGSDPLLIFLLKANKPEVYGGGDERKIAVYTGSPMPEITESDRIERVLDIIERVEKRVKGGGGDGREVVRVEKDEEEGEATEGVWREA